MAQNKKINKNIIPILAIFAVLIILSSSLLIYFDKNKEEKKEVEEPETIEIDNRISPLENQGVVLEINRLRHRGLYEKLKTPGNSWKTKPKFYFITDMDGLVYASRKVEQHGRVADVLFNSWDTMFQENKIMKDVMEENETSSISLTIVEIIEEGRIFKRTKEYKRDTMTIEYDFKTGRWSGDDNFKDKDGYGYYLGETFEIWFNVYQIDYDNDYIPYWTEVNVLGTDPRSDDSKRDPDGDGISTAWEWKWGYDPFTWDDHEKLDPDVDGLENLEEYQMAKWFADPFAQDVYVEVDWMGRNGLFDPPHVLHKECQQAVIEKYAEHQIRLFFDDGWPNGPTHGGGDILKHYPKISQDSGMMLQYYNNYFPEERRGIFRYFVIGHSAGCNHPSKGNVYDTMYISYNPTMPYRPLKGIKAMIQFGITPTVRGQRISVAAVVMHELGHSNGIPSWDFEGVDNRTYGIPIFPNKTFKDTWANYYSVMNYQCIYFTDLLDYSDGSNGPPYDQNDWEKLWVARFQYNDVLIEQPYHEPPALDKIVWGESEVGITGYVLDENLTKKWEEYIGDYSPMDPIVANWLVFKIEDREKYPNHKEIKILVQPNDVVYAGWAQYDECNLDSDGNFQFYSQQDLIDKAIENIS